MVHINMSVRRSLDIYITILILCQGLCFGLISWNMTNECGADISHDDYAGEISMHTDTSSLYTTQCSVTITPKPLDEHVPNRLMFYFTVYSYSGNCWQTNITLRDGRSTHDPEIEGLADYLCDDTSVLIDMVYYTTTPSLTIIYSSNKHGSTSSTRFTIKFMAYHTDSCSSADEHECSTGHCIPATYHCSPDINACRDTEQTCTEDNFEEPLLSSVFRNIGVIVVVILIFAACSKLLKSVRDKLCESLNKCGECCDAVRTKCLSCTTVPQRLVARVVYFIRDKCKKTPNRTVNIDTIATASTSERTRNWVTGAGTTTTLERAPDSLADDVIATTTNERTHDWIADNITTSSERSRGVEARVLGSNNTVNNTDNVSNIQIFHLLQALEEATDSRYNDVHIEPGSAPPDYEELFTPDHVFIPPPQPPPVLDNDNVLPVVPSYEEAIVDTPPEVIINIRALSDISNNEHSTLNALSSVRDSAEQSIETTQQVGDIECTPTAIRRLQTDCGFEHPFDFETEFDYYYSTDSDWETDSTATSASVDTLLQSSMTINIENTQANESNDSPSEASHQSSVTNNEIYSSDRVLECTSSSIPPQAESDIDLETGYYENTLTSGNALQEVPTEPPPPYVDPNPPPYYYDYIANVSMYKPS